MKKNLGSIDKVARLVIAAVIAILFFTNVISGVLGIILIILAVVFILTALINFCPIWYALGINTGKKES